MDRTKFKYGLLVIVTGIVGFLPFLFSEALPLSPIQPLNPICSFRKKYAKSAVNIVDVLEKVIASPKKK